MADFIKLCGYFRTNASFLDLDAQMESGHSMSLIIQASMDNQAPKKEQ
jgi:hypothetical protein